MARRRYRLEALARHIQEAGGTALVVDADITDPAQADAAVRQTVEHFGRLDTLVNNAGLMLLGPVIGADRDDWNRMIRVNIQGMLSVTHAADVRTVMTDPFYEQARLCGARSASVGG